MGESWHTKNEENTLKALGSSLNGLSSQESEKRLEQYGPNKLIERRGVNPLKIFLGQFKDIFVLMLLAAIIISLVIALTKTEAQTIEDYADTITIGAIVAFNAVFGFVNEYRSEKAIEAMRKMIAPKATVIRDDKETIIPAENIVPGDILAIETGDRIAADARLIEIVDLKTAEAVLTGESTPIEKKKEKLLEATPVSDRKNMVFMATHVLYGRGKAVVTATGMKTEFGKIAEMVQAIEKEETPLQSKLGKFGKKLGAIVVAACALIFILELFDPARAGDIIDSFLTAIALAVSAVPEGLPAVVTITLALGSRELARRNAIIRKLSSAETLGAVTIICSDKTGTLTKGEMTVRKIHVGNEDVEVTGVGYEAKGEFRRSDEIVNVSNNPDLSLFLRGATLCSNASYDGKKIIGDTTEGALIVAAAKAGFSKKTLEKELPRLYEIPFTSERKRMSTIHKASDGTFLAFMKGAPEVVLDLCTYHKKDGKKTSMTNNNREAILKVNEQMANQALRVLGIAYKENEIVDLNNLSENANHIEKGFVFLGLAGMIDPPREEAKAANQLCNKAGIKTIMITGDHQLTAIAVAKEIGIMKGADLALTGTELDQINDEKFDNLVEDVVVYARVSPEHKMRIVKALKNKNHIVAMTGDGVNDAPALKQADIGVAMGITGTDVTKEAADMVLADDNFATIVRAIEGGRKIYDNIRKFTFFLLRSNFDELLVIGSFAFLGLHLPLTAGMILWINLMTDGAPALALSQDPPSGDLMERAPRNPKEGVLHGRFASILASFLTQFLGTAVLFYLTFYVWGRPLEEARTIAFMQATLRELIVVWNCRSERKNAFKVGFTNNKYLLLAVVFSAALTFIVPYIGVFGTVPLSIQDWVLVIPVALAGFLLLPEIFYNRKILRWR